MTRWPSRDEVHEFAEEADARVLDALCRADLDRPGHPLLDRAEAVFTILEHEAMHHETLLYMWHRLPIDDKRRPAGYRPTLSDAAPGRNGSTFLAAASRWASIATISPSAGTTSFRRHDADVGGFSIERFNVTNAQFLEFVEAGGYENREWWRPEDWDWVQREGVSHPLFWERGETDWREGRDGQEGGTGRNGGTEWYWRGMFDRVPLPLAWPVYVSYAEAAAYARWRGVRLMTEAGIPASAFGSPDSLNGTRAPVGRRVPGAGAWRIRFLELGPEPAGTHPAGRSALGVDDLVGNGWEWTSSVFAPFPGFSPMASYPEYSADFFDGEHMVMKGASSGHGGRASAADVSQLVPAPVSLCLCDLPLRHRTFRAR